MTNDDYCQSIKAEEDDAQVYDNNLAVLVSVVIPLYNHEKYISETLDSIFQQDHSNVEIILIDDASTDNSLQLAKAKLVSCDVAYTVLENSHNLGVCKTINRGIRAAQGKYTCLIASDDILAIGRIKRHVKILENCTDINIVACHGPLQVISKDGTFLGLKGNRIKNKHYDLTSIVTKKTNPCLQGCTFITKKLKDFPFDENLFFEDWDFLIRLFLEGYNVLYDDVVSAHYRVVPDGVSKQIDKMIEARHDIRNKHFEAIASKDLKLARDFDFTISFWNFIGISHTGKMRAWILAFARLLVLNPKALIFRARDVAWSLKNLIRLKAKAIIGNT